MPLLGLDRRADGHPPGGSSPFAEALSGVRLEKLDRFFGFQISLVMVLYASARKKHLGGFNARFVSKSIAVGQKQ